MVEAIPMASLIHLRFSAYSVRRRPGIRPGGGVIELPTRKISPIKSLGYIKDFRRLNGDPPV